MSEEISESAIKSKGYDFPSYEQGYTDGKKEMEERVEALQKQNGKLLKVHKLEQHIDSEWSKFVSGAHDAMDIDELCDLSQEVYELKEEIIAEGGGTVNL